MLDCFFEMGKSQFFPTYWCTNKIPPINIIEVELRTFVDTIAPKFLKTFRSPNTYI